MCADKGKHDQGADYPTGSRSWRRVAEIGAPYLVMGDEDPSVARGVTRLSSKNQITLPVAMVRRLGLTPGDELDLTVVGDAIRVERRPRTAQEWWSGSRPTSPKALVPFPLLLPPPWVVATRQRCPTANATSGATNSHS